MVKYVFVQILLSVLFCVGVVACTHIALSDKYYQLDPPSHTLRGDIAAHDLPESDCDPIKNPDGSLQYKCVVHFYADYQALLDENARLQAELTACQQGK